MFSRLSPSNGADHPGVSVMPSKYPRTSYSPFLFCLWSLTSMSTWMQISLPLNSSTLPAAVILVLFFYLLRPCIICSYLYFPQPSSANPSTHMHTRVHKCVCTHACGQLHSHPCMCAPWPAPSPTFHVGCLLCGSAGPL